MITASVTFSPKYLAASSARRRRIIDEISSGEYCLPLIKKRTASLGPGTTL